MKNILMKLLLLSLLPCYSFGQWEQVPGIEGGTILATASADSILFAGTTSGVYCLRNVETGSWEHFYTPSSSQEVFTLTIYEQNLVIGTPEGIFLYDLSSHVVQDITANLLIDFVAKVKNFKMDTVQTIVAIIRYHGLYVYNASYQMWENWNDGLADPNVIDIIMDDQLTGTKDQPCFYTIISEGIFKSTGFGGTWQSFKSNPPVTPVYSIALINSSMVAGTIYGIFIGDLSSPGWAGMTTGPENAINQIYKVPLTGFSQCLLAATVNSGIFLSEDGGYNWSAVSSFPDLPEVLSFCDQEDYILAATNGSGMYRSTDLQEWNALNNGLNMVMITSIADIDGAILVGTAGAGVYTGWGTSYHKQNNGLNSLDISGVCNGGGFPVACAGGRMYYYDEINTENWIDFTYNLPDYMNRCTGIHYSDSSQKLVVAKTQGINWIYFYMENNWHPMNNGLNGVAPLCLLYMNGTYFIGTGSHGVYRFEKSDSSWVQMTTNGLGDLAINTITGSDGTIFVGTHLGVFRTSPPYEQWTDCTEGIYAPHTVCLEVAKNSLLANFYPSGCHSTLLDTIHWTARNDGLSELTVIYDFLSSGDHIYAGSNHSLWRREILGMSVINQPSSDGILVQVYPNPFSGTLHLSISGASSGQYLITLNDMHGKKIYETFKTTENQNPSTISIPADGLPGGLYYIRVQGNNGVSLVKVIKE